VNIIEVKNLVRSRQGEAIDDISFGVAEGDFALSVPAPANRPPSDAATLLAERRDHPVAAQPVAEPNEVRRAFGIVFQDRRWRGADRGRPGIQRALA
jgi:hypothetical protein